MSCSFQQIKARSALCLTMALLLCPAGAGRRSAGALLAPATHCAHGSPVTWRHTASGTGSGCSWGVPAALRRRGTVGSRLRLRELSSSLTERPRRSAWLCRPACGGGCTRQRPVLRSRQPSPCSAIVPLFGRCRRLRGGLVLQCIHSTCTAGPALATSSECGPTPPPSSRCSCSPPLCCIPPHLIRPNMRHSDSFQPLLQLSHSRAQATLAM